MALATSADVETSLLRPLSEQEKLFVPGLLERAERILSARMPDLGQRATVEEFRATVVDVEAEAVARVVRNPEGITSESEGLYSFSRNAKVASGVLSILDEEWVRLGQPCGAVASVGPQTDAYLAARRRYRWRGWELA